MKKFQKWGGYATELEFKTEEQLSKACFDWFDSTFEARLRGMLTLNFNNPKDARQGNQLRAQGLRKGMPDMTLHAPKMLYIELKLDSGKLSPEQVQQMDKLRSWGHTCVVVCSLEAFKEVLTNHLELCGVIPLSDL